MERWQIGQHGYSVQVSKVSDYIYIVDSYSFGSLACDLLGDLKHPLGDGVITSNNPVKDFDLMSFYGHLGTLET